jgi:polar amino acid transport system substrate-binding protein
MLRLRRAVAICVLVLASLLTTQATAAAQNAPVLSRILDSGTLRVGMSGTQPPFNVMSRTGNMIGLEVDLATVLALAMQVELEIVRKPFGDLLSALEAGQVDMVMSGLTINAERSRRVSFVGPYMLSGKSILTKSATLASADSTVDLNKPSVKLAALANSTSQRFIERHAPQAQLVTVAAYDEGVQMVLDDQVDALVADMPICLITMMRYPDRGLATLNEPLTLEPIGLAVSASDPQLLNLVENYIETLERTAVLEQLRQKWLEDGSWIAALP